MNAPETTKAAVATRIASARETQGEAQAFSSVGKVTTHISRVSLDNISVIFDRMKAGHFDGSIVRRI